MGAWVGKYRRLLCEGGARSSKTWSILQGLILIAMDSATPKNTLISVVSESLPHLKRGAQRDFFNILEESAEGNPYFNKTEGTYRRWNAVFEFFGADDKGKARGTARQILFINEANNVQWDVAQNMDARTEIFTVCDWNPVSEFWAHEYWMGEKDTYYSHSTYLDAKHVLPQSIVDTIESYKDKDPNWWRIYGEGKVGKIEGLVYPYFEIIDELPEGDVFYGLDFGFSDDPTVLVKNVIIGDNLYSQELIYETGLTNDVIARKMDQVKVKPRFDEIYADSAEPKSIEELAKLGYNVKPCVKGRGSVQYGIQKVNQCYQHWTKDSINCIKEQRNFRYIEDKDGNLTEKTTHVFSHGMDARRYAVMTRNTPATFVRQRVVSAF